MTDKASGEGILFARASISSPDPPGDNDRVRLTGGGGSDIPVQAANPSPRPESLRGLDWFIFFLADVQTGFGPFVAVYLTTEKWTQVQIGFVLSIGGIVGLIGQMPGGAIVDAARSERLVAGLAVATIGLSALSYAVWPIFPVVAAAATRPAAFWGRQSQRSASAWSVRLRSASGWGAMHVSPRSATAPRPP
jgi:predicted MFS family arabinose efflux permease